MFFVLFWKWSSFSHKWKKNSSFPLSLGEMTGCVAYVGNDIEHVIHCLVTYLGWCETRKSWLILDGERMLKAYEYHFGQCSIVLSLVESFWVFRCLGFSHKNTGEQQEIMMLCLRFKVKVGQRFGGFLPKKMLWNLILIIHFVNYLLTLDLVEMLLTKTKSTYPVWRQCISVSCQTLDPLARAIVPRKKLLHFLKLKAI